MKTKEQKRKEALDRLEQDYLDACKMLEARIASIASAKGEYKMKLKQAVEDWRKERDKKWREVLALREKFEHTQEHRQRGFYLTSFLNL